MKVFVQALVIFFGTLLVAALVALGRPAQATQDAFVASQMLAAAMEPRVLHHGVGAVAAA